MPISRSAYKAKHPYYIRAEEKIASLRESMNEQAKSVIASVQQHAQIAKATEEQLRQLVDSQKKEQLNVEQLRIQYGVLKRKADAADLLYKTVLARMKETALTGRNKINNMNVVDEANVPIRPIKPRIVLTILLGLMGGLGIAVGLAFFVNYLDDSIKSQDDVETYLRFPSSVTSPTSKPTASSNATCKRTSSPVQRGRRIPDVARQHFAHA